ncbi:MAG: DUF3891 family protein [Acidobacteriia bacterium]|nr:DUF3891 family protein [Terriglobia bacterium]
MILYPLNSVADATSPGHGPDHDAISAWEAIECSQRQPATAWWLIAQPDHAALAGDLAGYASSPCLPTLDEDVLQAIRLHDEGWNLFDRGTPEADYRGRPLSFFDVTPPDFVRAWLGSIERAQQVAPISGIMVSEHFCRIAQFRLQTKPDTPEYLRIIHEFLVTESERQRQLSQQQRRSPEEIRVLVDVLQLCDLISLYLCCGSPAAVAFPQQFHGQSFRAHREGELCRTEPPLFGRGASLSVAARRFPASPETGAANLPFLIV